MDEIPCFAGYLSDDYVCNNNDNIGDIPGYVGDNYMNINRGVYDNNNHNTNQSQIASQIKPQINSLNLPSLNTLISPLSPPPINDYYSQYFSLSQQPQSPHYKSVPHPLQKSKFYIDFNENNNSNNNYNDNSFDSFSPNFPQNVSPIFSDKIFLDGIDGFNEQIMDEPIFNIHQNQYNKHDLKNETKTKPNDESKQCTKSTSKQKKPKSKRKSKESSSKQPSTTRPKKRKIKTIKNDNNSSKKVRKSTSRNKKRKRREMEDTECDNDEFIEPSPQKRKCNNKDIEEYIYVTLTQKQCKKRFNDYIENGDVLINAANKEYICRITECNKKFKAKCHLKRHCDEIHIGRRFECRFPQCSYSSNGGNFKQRSQCKEHIGNRHFYKKDEWQCFLCHDTFSRWHGVRRHIEWKRCEIIKNNPTNLSKKQIDTIIEEAKNGESREKCKI